MNELPNRSLCVALIATTVLLGHAVESRATLVTISSLETWDGVINPHAAQGVTLTTASGVATYTIPDGMQINSGGQIRFFDSTVRNLDLRFVFAASGGGMQINRTGDAFIMNDGDRGSPHAMTWEMNNNDITSVAGGGNFQPPPSPSLASRDSFNFSILGGAGADITLGNIDLTRVDGFAGNVNITTGGAVNIGSILTADTYNQGNTGADVTIRAPQITVGAISTFTERFSSSLPNGNVLMEALGYPSFDETVGGWNYLVNTLTLNGPIKTEGTSGQNQANGNITLRGVIVTLGSGFAITKESDAVLTLEAGIVHLGKTAGDLFIDNAPGVFTATHNVQWVPEPAGSTHLLVILGAIPCWLRRRHLAR